MHLTNIKLNLTNILFLGSYAKNQSTSEVNETSAFIFETISFTTVFFGAKKGKLERH
jgi:hypothetical protein